MRMREPCRSSTHGPSPNSPPLVDTELSDSDPSQRKGPEWIRDPDDVRLETNACAGNSEPAERQSDDCRRYQQYLYSLIDPGMFRSVGGAGREEEEAAGTARAGRLRPSGSATG